MDATYSFTQASDMTMKCPVRLAAQGHAKISSFGKVIFIIFFYIRRVVPLGVPPFDWQLLRWGKLIADCADSHDVGKPCPPECGQVW